MVENYIDEYFIIFFFIMLHEFGHIFTAVTLGKKISSIRIFPIGLNAVIEDTNPKRYEKVLIYLSGPLVNLIIILFFGFYGEKLVKSELRYDVILINTGLLIFNLLPILPFDGAKVLMEILSERVGLIRSNFIIKRISLFLSCFLILVGFIQIFSTIIGLSLILIGFYIIFILIKSDKTEASIMNVKDVIYRRSRILKKGIYPARDLVVVKSMKLSDVLKCLDFDRFHIIHVLDENLKLVKICTEQDIIDGLLNNNTDITFEEFMKNNN